MYKYDEVYKSTLAYFNGDNLATNSWMNKYALKDYNDNYYELNPDDMHKRIAKELARIEAKYNSSITEDDYYQLLKNFSYIVPGGSIMSGIGNTLQTVSMANCYVIDGAEDSYGGICKTDQEQVQLMKRRGGVGHDLGKLRPKGMQVKNSALTSTGMIPFMERFSNSTREVAQDGRRGALMLSLTCFSNDTLVLTNNGWLNIVDIIEQIMDNKELFAIDDTGKLHPIINPVINEPEQIYEVETEDGTIIEVTANHEFEVRNISTNEIYLKKLKDIDINNEELKIISPGVE